MTSIFRQSDLTKVPKGSDIDNSYWNYFLLLEKDFEKTLQYVHIDESNYKTS